MNFFNKEQWLGVSRQLLTFLAGFLALKGYIDSDAVEMVSAAAISLVTIGFSWNSPDKEEIIERLYGIARHLATLLGGFGLLEGWFDSDTFMLLGGSLISLFGVIWSIYSKKKLNSLSKGMEGE